MTLTSDAFHAATLQDRRPAVPRRRRGSRLPWICGTAALAVVLGTGISPTAVEPTGEALAMLAEGWHAAAALPAAARGALSRRFPRFHHAPAEARRAPAPSAEPVRLRVAAPAASHRMDAPDAALAARFAPIPNALEDEIALAAASEDRNLDPVTEDAAPGDLAAVPLPRAAEAAREEALGHGDIAALVVPLPSSRPEIDDADEAVPPTNPLVARPSAPPQRKDVPVLAYARPDAGALATPEPEIPSVPAAPARTAPRAERGTAIYDISAATVYLPNGERLEAHSGLGAMRDNVRFVHQKNRGPTPPHTYDLTMRESLFHGVQALRLNPVGGQRNVYNRVGLLAHTYMLGPRGDSNGCVSFKDYKRFLAAYQRGEIRRLVVVDKLDAAAQPKPSLLTRLFRSAG
ncbi:DUF2778 domain-containing protein [Aureimonas jatrophae]|nr:DUF2778 domain-containing protein [Aureimonas jatrophae]MBB3950787.1 hypothetical protein [Aureimonas jatrophae]